MSSCFSVLGRCILWACVESEDSVGQVVAERRGDDQRLHLLGGHHPTQRHPAQVLQGGRATGARPEEHAAVTGPSQEQRVRSLQVADNAGQMTGSPQRRWATSHQGRSHSTLIEFISETEIDPLRRPLLQHGAE